MFFIWNVNKVTKISVDTLIKENNPEKNILENSNKSEFLKESLSYMPKEKPFILLFDFSKEEEGRLSA